MKIEDQVCSLELAKRLKELGVKQESYFVWYERRNEKESVILRNNDPIMDARSWASAFTVAELGEMLPTEVSFRRVFIGAGECFEACSHERDLYVRKLGDTEAHTRSKILIYLIENNLIQLRKET